MANKRLYIGGLPYEVTDDRLREVFLAHGNVESASVITDRYSGESRGFGFVEMGTAEEAAAAQAQADKVGPSSNSIWSCSDHLQPHCESGAHYTRALRH